MIRLPVLMGALAALVLSACSVTTVGIPCETRDDCAPAQDCFATPGGFCTRGCTEPGETKDCPAGTICTFFGADRQVCSPECFAASDCRVNYECVEVGGTTARKACRPER